MMTGERKIIMYWYKVRFWDVDAKNFEEETGVVGAKTWKQAAAKLQKWYGDDMSRMMLEEMEDVVDSDSMVNYLTEDK